MVEYRTKKKDLFVSFYLNGGQKNLILANGIPSYVTKYHPLVKFCEENKINLFIPQYYGSFESNGNFSLANCTKAIKETFDMVKSGKTVELFANKSISWDNKEILLFGHSFGALPLLLSDLDKEKAKMVLSCPFVNLEKNNLGGGSAQNDLYFIERAYPNLYRFKAKELLKEYGQIKYPSKSNFIMITGKSDPVIPQVEYDFLKNKYKPKTFEFEGGHTIHLDTLKKIIL